MMYSGITRSIYKYIIHLLFPILVSMVKQHIPILVDEIISQIPPHSRYIVDGTCGHGGHTLHFLSWLSSHQ